jgi:hypothetical protein
MYEVRLLHLIYVLYDKYPTLQHFFFFNQNEVILFFNNIILTIITWLSFDQKVSQVFMLIRHDNM